MTEAKKSADVTHNHAACDLIVKKHVLKLAKHHITLNRASL